MYAYRSKKLVRKKCVRCPWALQRERSVQYFGNYFSFLSFQGHILFFHKGLSYGREILGTHFPPHYAMGGIFKSWF